MKQLQPQKQVMKAVSSKELFIAATKLLQNIMDPWLHLNAACIPFIVVLVHVHVNVRKL